MKSLIVVILTLGLFFSAGFAKSASPVLASSVFMNAPEDQKKADAKGAPEAKKEAKVSKKKKGHACCDSKAKEECSTKDKKECDAKSETKAEQK